MTISLTWELCKIIKRIQNDLLLVKFHCWNQVVATPALKYSISMDRTLFCQLSASCPWDTISLSQQDDLNVRNPDDLGTEKGIHRSCCVWHCQEFIGRKCIFENTLFFKIILTRLPWKPLHRTELITLLLHSLNGPSNVHFQVLPDKAELKNMFVSCHIKI